MSSHAKFQNNSEYKVLSKNGKRTFLSSDPFPDDFSKILFYQVSLDTFLCVAFRNPRPNSLGRKESHRNNRSGCLGSLLTQINN